MSKFSTIFQDASPSHSILVLWKMTCSCSGCCLVSQALIRAYIILPCVPSVHCAKHSSSSGNSNMGHNMCSSALQLATWLEAPASNQGYIVWPLATSLKDQASNWGHMVWPLVPSHKAPASNQGNMVRLLVPSWGSPASNPDNRVRHLLLQGQESVTMCCCN